MSFRTWMRKFGVAWRGDWEANSGRAGPTWRTLLQYARAASEFTSIPAMSLPASSFDRLMETDQTYLPEVQMFKLADAGNMAFRHYALQEKNVPAVVLVHGSAGHSGQLHCLARAITDRGLGEAYTLDLRGHGSSPGRRGHAVRHDEQLCSDVCQFLHFLDSTRPAAPIILGGHSAGGGLVLRVSRSSASCLLSGCFFLAPYLGLGAPTIRPFFGGWVTVRVNRLRALALANALGISWLNGATTVGFNLGRLCRDGAYASSWSFNTMLAFGPGLWSTKSRRIDAEIEVFSVCGDKDECFISEAYPEAFRAVAPQAEVVTVENCGHWDILVDAQVMAVVTNWLRRVLSDRPARTVAV
jgi:non-heme chloroperoxidase